MIGVIGESHSDAQCLVNLIRNIASNNTLPVRKKGYNNCGEMLRKAASQIRAYSSLGVEHFVICHDADGPDPAPVRRRVLEQVAYKCGLPDQCCVVIPVEEIEAWLLADERAVAQVIPTFKLAPITSPELVRDPKEHLEGLSRGANAKPKYIHSVHNERVCQHIRVDVVEQKCPSFRPFVQFVQQHA